MKILGFEIKWGSSGSQNNTTRSVVYQGVDEIGSVGHRYPIVDKYYDGEKNLGELGVVQRIVPDFKKLRLRMYSAYATIDTIKIIASKFFYWTIGSGLKLQAEPERTVLESEGIVNSKEVYAKFQKVTEARFKIYANSKMSDYKGKNSLHDLALETYQGEFLGGDMLCVVRFNENGPNMQVISGEHVCDPDLDKYSDALAASGNEIKHGIELDEKGAHVAFYVKTCKKDKVDKWERIPAIGEKSQKVMAWMVSGKKISPDHIRSVPQMSQSLEKVNKLDRYTEATVTKVEQGAKIVHTIEHQEFSTGENPLKSIVQQKRGESVITGNDMAANMKLADGLANRMNETAPGMTYNMPNGSTLNSFESKAEGDYPAFKKAIFEEVSAGSDVPPEVAMQQYNSNYSASRAAINSFGYIIEVNRTKFANDFYIPFYKLWLEFQILSNKIVAPGYLENIDNFMVTESYAQCRFTGRNMPHIDPLKEIKAIREMLGINDKSPLISREQATEALGAGQWDENFQKNLEEANIIPKEMLEPEKKAAEVETKPKVKKDGEK
jgi:capsid protein